MNQKIQSVSSTVTFLTWRPHNTETVVNNKPESKDLSGTNHFSLSLFNGKLLYFDFRTEILYLDPRLQASRA